MHTDLADSVIASFYDDLINTRGDQLANDGVATRNIRSDGNHLTRLPAGRVTRVSGCGGDCCGVRRRMQRFLRAHLAASAMSDRGNTLSPAQ